MDFSKVFQVIGTDIIGPILIGTAITAVVFLKDWFKRKHKRFSIKITAEKNDRIQELLLEIRIRLQADRAYLGMFHNGDKFVEGSEILKMSRTNESANPGVSLEAQHYQNILISLVPDETTLITADGPGFITVAELKDGKFKRMLESRGIQSVARAGIRKGKDIIGFVGLDFNHKTDPPTNIEELLKYAGILEQVLSDYRAR